MSRRLYSPSTKNQQKKQNNSNLPKVLILKIALAIRIITNQTKKQKRLYAHIYGIVMNLPACFKSAENMYKSIENQYGIGRSTCIRAMKELVDNGIIIRFYNKSKHRWERKIAPYLKNIDIYDPPKEVKDMLWKLEMKDREDQEKNDQNDLDIYANFTRENDQTDDHAYNTLDPSFNKRTEPSHFYKSSSKEGFPVLGYENKSFNYQNRQFLKNKIFCIPENKYHFFDQFPEETLNYAHEKCNFRMSPENIKKFGKVENPAAYFTTICKKRYSRNKNMKT